MHRFTAERTEKTAADGGARAESPGLRDALRAVLSDSQRGGAIVVGDSRLHQVLAEAAAGLDPQPPIIHLNGSRYAAQTRYGVLSFLLSQLDAPPSDSRREVVQAVARHLGERRVIVTLGSPHLIDGESAPVLAQLVVMGKISLIIECARVSDVPPDLLALYRSGLIVRIDEPGMDVRETRRFLETELGGTVSTYAAAVLWHMCGAERDLIRGLARAMVSQGKLRRDGEFWVLTPATFVPADLRVPQLAGITPGERRLLLLLAIGGPVGPADLRRCGYVERAADLLSRGLVTIADSVSIAVPLIAHILREKADEEDLAGLDRALADLHPDPTIARVMTEVRTKLDLGSDAAAADTVEAFVRSGGFSAEAWRADPDRRSLLLEARFHALSWLGSRERIAAIARASEGLAAAHRARPGDRRLTRAKQHMRLLGAREAVFSGRYGEVDRLPHTLWETESLHFKALAAQSEAWAMGSRQRDALALADSVDAEISALRLAGVLDQVMTPGECADIECTLLRVRLLSGEWRLAARVARRLAEGRYPSPRAIAFGDTIGGVLSALAHEQKARDVLLSSAHQFAVSYEGEETGAVQAAAAFCAGDAGAPPPAAAATMPVSFVVWAGEILDCLRRAQEDAPDAIARLRDLADRCRGSQMLEMGALAVAVRLGDRSAAKRLEALAATSSAPSAEGYRLLARGVSRGDGACVAEGLEILIRHGQLLFSGGDGGVLVDMLSRRDRRRIEARVSQGRPTAQSAPDSSDQPAWLTRLTRRERQIAEHAVAGMSNSAIARRNGVSIRTVEGHLYQIYSKLHVRNRQELTALERASRAGGPS